MSFSSGIEHNDDAVDPGCSGAWLGQEHSVWHLLYGFPYVLVCDIRLIEQEQGALEVIQYVLLGFAVSYVLEEVQISLFGTPELLV